MCTWAVATTCVSNVRVCVFTHIYMCVRMWTTPQKAHAQSPLPPPQQQQQQEEGDGSPSPSSSSSSITVDLHDDMRCLTLEAVAQASFSLRLGLLEKGLAEGRVYEYDDVDAADAGNKGGGDAYDVGAADAGAGNKGSRRKKRRFTGKRVDFLVREGFRLVSQSVGAWMGGWLVEGWLGV